MLKKIFLMIILIVVLIIVLVLSYERYYYQDNYSMRQGSNPEIIDIISLSNEQIFVFDRGQSYLISGDYKTFSSTKIYLNLLYDEENYEGSNSIRLLGCKQDIFGKEYCEIKSLLSLKSPLTYSNDSNSIVSGKSCIIINNPQLKDLADCYKIENDDFKMDGIPFLGSIFKGGKDISWKLLINAGSGNILSTKLLLKKI